MRVKTSVKGLSYNRGHFNKDALFEIRIAADSIGKSLSIIDPSADIQFVIPLEPLARYIRVKEVRE